MTITIITILTILLSLLINTAAITHMTILTIMTITHHPDHHDYHAHHHPDHHDYHSPWMETHVAGPPLLSQSLAIPNLLNVLSFQLLTVTWNLRFIIRHLFTHSLRMCKWVGEKVGSGPLAQVDFRENILNFLEQLVLKRKFGGKGVGSYLILLCWLLWRGCLE